MADFAVPCALLSHSLLFGNTHADPFPFSHVSGKYMNKEKLISTEGKKDSLSSLQESNQNHKKILGHDRQFYTKELALLMVQAGAP